MENVMMVMEYVRVNRLAITIDKDDCVIITDRKGFIILKSCNNKGKAFKDIREKIETIREDLNIVLTYVRSFGLGLTRDVQDNILICDNEGAIIFKSYERGIGSYIDLKEQIEEYVVPGFRIAAECAYALED